MKANAKSQKGFVSIFIVIFSAILISIITISFIRLMINDQQQATSNDLSRSAYDSALAGVEDAKRALLSYSDACNGGDAVACQKAKDLVNAAGCNGVFGKEASAEVAIKTGDDNLLNQAYTCVKIQMDTDNYLGSLSRDSYKMIPLSAVGSFDTIQLEWFSAENVTSGSVNALNSIKTPLYSAASNTPPIMRTQVIQFAKSGFSLKDLDDGIGTSGADMSISGANTLFLYPTSSTTAVSSVKNISTIDGRRISPESPQRVICTNLSSSTAYSCKTLVQLPALVAPADIEAYLILSAFYNNADYKVTLLNSADASATPVKFNGVQPEIDSTGRANDLFRRVKTRVELTDVNFPYPEAAVDITGSLCKTFSITDNAADYDAGACTD